MNFLRGRAADIRDVDGQKQGLQSERNLDSANQTRGNKQGLPHEERHWCERFEYLTMSHTIQMDDVDFDWHSKTVQEVEQLQQTSMTNGLSTAEAIRRLEAYGKNELPAPDKTPFYVRLWNQLNNILIFILFGAAIVCGFLQEWAEVALICGVVVINVTIGLVQEGKAEAAADAIKGMLSANAIVVRNGEQTSIPAVSTRCPPPPARETAFSCMCMCAFSFLRML